MMRAFPISSEGGLPRRLAALGALLAGALIASNISARAEPPFWGTIFIDPDIITSADPSAYQGAVEAGQGMRQMYDRRVNNWVQLNAYLFNAAYHDGLTIEVQVNPEFGSVEAARAQAEKYAEVIGRLPKALRLDVATVWIHDGLQPFGGGNNNLLIHIGQADEYARDGILEETFVHEAAHTSLDAAHAAAAGWLAAQRDDGEFISVYARDNPTREDIAESFLPYFAARYRTGRISAALADTIAQTIPNRMAYFDALNLDLRPVEYPHYLPVTSIQRDGGQVRLTWSSIAGIRYQLLRSPDLRTWSSAGDPITATGGQTTVERTVDPSDSAQYFRLREL